MEAQYNFQMKPKSDKNDWEKVEIFSQFYCERTTAIRYAKVFQENSNQKSALQREKNLSKQAEHTFTKTTIIQQILWQIGATIK